MVSPFEIDHKIGCLPIGYFLRKPRTPPAPAAVADGSIETR